MKFRGNIHQLKIVTNSFDPHGKWVDSRHQYQFRATSGGILNWWPNTGTMNFQGPGWAADELEDAIVPRLKLRRHQNAPRNTPQPSSADNIIEGDYTVVQIGGQPRRVFPALGKPSLISLPFKRSR